MADEQPIMPDMVVRLLGNADAYFSMMKKAADETKAAADKIKAEAAAVENSLGVQAVKGAKEFASAVQVGISVASNFEKLAKGKFDTVGQSIGMVGQMAAAIPGPFGVVASTVLSSLGSIVDYFDRHLIRAQKAAREGFMSIASGAQTAQEAIVGIQRSGMMEGMEQVVRDLQNAQQLGAFGSNVLGIGDRDNQNLAEMMGMGNEQQRAAAETTMANYMSRAERAANMLRELLDNPVLQESRRRVGALTTNQEIISRAAASGEMRLQRDMMRAMAQGDIERITFLQREVAIRRMIRRDYTDSQGNEVVPWYMRGIMTARQMAERSLDPNALRVAREAAMRDVAQRRDTQAEEMRKKLVEERLGLYDKEVLARMKLEGATDRDIRAEELRMSIETRARTMRQGGSTPAQIATIRQQMEQNNAQTLYNELLRDVDRVTRQNHTSQETYNDTIRDLDQLMSRMPFSMETYNRAVDRALRQTARWREWNAVVQEGVSIIARFEGPEARLFEQTNAVEQAFRAGQIGAEEYATGIARLNDEYEGLLQTISPVQQVAYNSADALQRVSAQAERFTVRAPSLEVSQVIRDVTGERGAREARQGELGRLYDVLARVARATELTASNTADDPLDDFAPADLGGPT